MHKIEVKYLEQRMFRKPVDKTLRIESPETWDELTRIQVESVAKVISMDVPLETQKTILFSELSNIPMRVFSMLNEFQILSLYDCVDVFLGEPHLTKNHWPKVKGLVGPSDFFGNLIVDEFIEAEDYYFDYMEEARERYPDREKMESLLDLLIATLWREKDKMKDARSHNFTGDWRVPFSSYHVKNRAKKVEKISPAIRQAIFYYYEGSRRAMVDLNDALFGESDGSKESADKETWIKMLGHLPNDKFGTLEKIGPKNLHTVFYFCNLFIQDAKEQKRSSSASD